MTETEIALSNGFVAGSLKIALEYNAAVVATASVWCGNIKTEHDLRKFKEALAAMDKGYEESQERLLKNLEDQLAKGGQ